MFAVSSNAGVPVGTRDDRGDEILAYALYFPFALNADGYCVAENTYAGCGAQLRILFGAAARSVDRSVVIVVVSVAHAVSKSKSTPSNENGLLL